MHVNSLLLLWLLISYHISNADDRRTRNLYDKLVRVNLRKKLVRVSYRLAARFFSCEFLASNKTCSIWCEKPAITWLNYAHWLDTRGGRKPPASVDASFSHEKLASKIWCKFLVRVFVASFLYKFLVRLSSALEYRTIHSTLCLSEMGMITLLEHCTCSRPVTHAQTWAFSCSAVYRLCSLSQKC